MPTEKPRERSAIKPPCRCPEGKGIEHVHTPAGLMNYRAAPSTYSREEEIKRGRVADARREVH